MAEVIQNTNEDESLAYTRRNEFTSEIYKMELKGLPKYFAPGDLKKLMESKDLEVKKVKPTGRGKGFCFITFANEESLQRALTELDGFKWKGNTFSTSRAAAAHDPLVKARQERQNAPKPAAGKIFKADDEQVDLLPLDDRVVKIVTPFAHLPYEEQLEKKQETALGIMRRLGNEIIKVNPGLGDFVKFNKLRRKGSVCELDDIISSPVIKGYRNKCEFTVGINPETNELAVGFRVSSYKDGCVSVGPVVKLANINDTMKTLCVELEKLFRASSHASFDPITHEGVWRQVMMRTSVGGECMVMVSMHPQQLTESQLQDQKNSLINLCKSLEGPHKISSLYVSIEGQKKDNKDVFEHLWGTTHITETMLNKKFRISPNAFFQVNTACAEKLYSKIVSVAGVCSSTILLDVCCGTGTIGLSMAEHCSRVYGLELVESAVADAEHNAALQGVTNTSWMAGDCRHTLPIVLGQVRGQPTTAVLDPPRNGVPGSVMQSVRSQTEIKRLVYVACDPARIASTNLLTLSRPASKTLKGPPFVPTRAVAVDLFPHTDKLEMVIVFERFDQTRWSNIVRGEPAPEDEEYFRGIPKLGGPTVQVQEESKKRKVESEVTETSKKQQIEDIVPV